LNLPQSTHFGSGCRESTVIKILQTTLKPGRYQKSNRVIEAAETVKMLPMGNTAKIQKVTCGLRGTFGFVGRNKKSAMTINLHMAGGEKKIP
jgi:hypothetical protein